MLLDNRGEEEVLYHQKEFLEEGEEELPLSEFDHYTMLVFPLAKAEPSFDPLGRIE